MRSATLVLSCAGVGLALVTQHGCISPLAAVRRSSGSSSGSSCAGSGCGTIVEARWYASTRSSRTCVPVAKLRMPARARRSTASTKGVIVSTNRFRPPSLVEGATKPAFSTRLSNVLINEALLIAVLAITTFAVLTVDQSAWRGWYFHEIVYRIPLDNWNAYESAVAEYPVPLKAAITGVTYLAGDWLAQANSLQRDGRSWLDADRGRLGRATLVGLVLLGPLAHFYYEFVNDELTEWPIYAKILFDQTAYLALYNTVYYVALLCLDGKSFGEALEDYKGQFWRFLTSGWKLWPLVGIVTYTIIPQQNRVLWIDGIEIIYSAILSSLANVESEGAD